MRMHSGADPPVMANPKPSIGWYCASSLTSTVGRELLDAEKGRGPCCALSSCDRSGVVNHKRICYCAIAGRQIRNTHTALKADRDFMSASPSFHSRQPVV